MTAQIHKGCAATDGQPFRDWFVGPLSDWSETQPASTGLLRNSHQVQVKWSLHPAASRRPNEWAAPGPFRSLCILLEGQLSFFFRSPGTSASETEYILEKPGEYVMWEGETEHLWISHQESRVITIRWLEEPS